MPDVVKEFCAKHVGDEQGHSSDIGKNGDLSQEEIDKIETAPEVANPVEEAKVKVKTESKSDVKE